MISLDALTTDEIKKIQVACSHLFPSTGLFDNGFLLNLTSDTLKKAYRKRVKGFHPDLYAQKSKEEIARTTESFRVITDSYTFLSAFLNGEKLRQSSACDKKIIAVGGSKGGVGKSLFAANLAVLLAKQGYRTVAIDLDLGGANLPIYLGENYLLERTINDYLDKKYPRLEDIMTKGRHGPRIIGGDSSQLGSANIPFARKLKLLRAIRNIDADFVVLDLGGDTSYNMLDFFLAGDCGIVMTTRDTASYIGAYQFIKTALYRKLNRLHGAENSHQTTRNFALVRLIKEATASSEHPVDSIEELIRRIREKEPIEQSLVIKTILGFKPYLVVNKVTNPGHASQVVNTIRGLSKKMLSLDVVSPGYISRHREIEDSLIATAPVAAAWPAGGFAREMGGILERIVGRVDRAQPCMRTAEGQ